MLARSVAVALWSAGLLPTPARAAWNVEAFTSTTMDELARSLGLSMPVESRSVRIDAPEIAEDGTSVPMVVSTTLPDVARLLLVVAKNPNVLSAMFEANDAVEASYSIRVKMNESSTVMAVAVMTDGRVLFAAKELKVTQGGCGG